MATLADLIKQNNPEALKKLLEKKEKVQHLSDGGFSGDPIDAIIKGNKPKFSTNSDNDFLTELQKDLPKSKSSIPSKSITPVTEPSAPVAEETGFVLKPKDYYKLRDTGELNEPEVDPNKIRASRAAARNPIVPRQEPLPKTEAPAPSRLEGEGFTTKPTDYYRLRDSGQLTEENVDKLRASRAAARNPLMPQGERGMSSSQEPLFEEPPTSSRMPSRSIIPEFEPRTGGGGGRGIPPRVMPEVTGEGASRFRFNVEPPIEGEILPPRGIRGGTGEPIVGPAVGLLALQQIILGLGKRELGKVFDSPQAKEGVKALADAMQRQKDDKVVQDLPYYNAFDNTKGVELQKGVETSKQYQDLLDEQRKQLQPKTEDKELSKEELKENQDLVRNVASNENVNPAEHLAQTEVESGFKPWAVSTSGASGMGQHTHIGYKDVQENDSRFKEIPYEEFIKPENKKLQSIAQASEMNILRNRFAKELKNKTPDEQWEFLLRRYNQGNLTNADWQEAVRVGVNPITKQPFKSDEEKAQALRMGIDGQDANDYVRKAKEAKTRYLGETQEEKPSETPLTAPVPTASLGNKLMDMLGLPTAQAAEMGRTPASTPETQASKEQRVINFLKAKPGEDLTPETGPLSYGPFANTEQGRELYGRGMKSQKDLMTIKKNYDDSLKNIAVQKQELDKKTAELAQKQQSGQPVSKDEEDEARNLAIKLQQDFIKATQEREDGYAKQLKEAQRKGDLREIAADFANYGAIFGEGAAMHSGVGNQVKLRKYTQDEINKIGQKDVEKLEQQIKADAKDPDSDYSRRLQESLIPVLKKMGIPPVSITGLSAEALEKVLPHYTKLFEAKVLAASKVTEREKLKAEMKGMNMGHALNVVGGTVGNQLRQQSTAADRIFNTILPGINANRLTPDIIKSINPNILKEDNRIQVAEVGVELNKMLAGGGTPAQATLNKLIPNNINMDAAAISDKFGKLNPAEQAEFLKAALSMAYRAKQTAKEKLNDMMQGEVSTYGPVQEHYPELFQQGLDTFGLMNPKDYSLIKATMKQNNLSFEQAEQILLEKGLIGQ